MPNQHHRRRHANLSRYDSAMIAAARDRRHVTISDGREGTLFGWNVDRKFGEVRIGGRHYRIPHDDITLTPQETPG